MKPTVTNSSLGIMDHVIRYLLAILLLFIDPCFSSDDHKSHEWGNFIYEPGEWETMILDLISRQVPSLPIQAFSDEPQLLQKVDRGNKISVYFHPPQDGSAATEKEIYRRKNVDSKMPVIVLRSEEDHLPVYERKRTFIVLRQNPETNNTYFASYAYLRFFTDKQDNCIETYLNEKVCIEWDSWDGDRSEVKMGHKFFGWADCASSFLFSCISSNSSKSEKNAKNDSITLVDRGYRNQTLTFQDKGVVYKSASGFMDDTIDVLFDLETGQGEGRYVRETIRHSSIFRKPSQLGQVIVTGGSSTASGRSITREGSVQQRSSDLAKLKEKLVERSREDRNHREMLHAKLEDRIGWFRNKAGLNNLLRKYVQEFGYHTLDTVKKEAMLWRRFTNFRNVSDVLAGLAEMGAEYVGNNEVGVNETKSNSIKTEQVSILQGADMSRGLINSKNDGEDDSSLTASFGRALGAIMLQSGGGMRGRALDEMDNKVAATIAKSILFSSTDTFQIPGWKLQLLNPNEFRANVTLSLENVTFYGMGSCPYKILNDNETTDDITFYLTLFRTHCLPEARQYLEHLLTGKYIAINRNDSKTVPYFSIPKNEENEGIRVLLKKSKLRREEVHMLGAALELVAFTQTYVTILGKALKQHEATSNKTSDVEKSLSLFKSVSKSVHCILQFGLKYVTIARKLGDEHFVKLVRNLVVTLKGVMTKLIQDEEMLLALCVPTRDACKMELDLNAADILGIHTLSQFLIRGLAPVEKSLGIGVENVFEQFVRDNGDSLEVSVKFYN